MRKLMLAATLMILAIGLVACGSSNNTSSRNASSAGASRALSPTTTLAVGTLKLEGTDQAVDATMAAKLLPLWQLMNQLDSSSSTAPQEVSAVLDQIQSTMTPGQVRTIQGMQLSQRDIFTALQQTGAIPAGFGAGSTDPGSDSTNRTGNGGGGGVFFGGGVPGGGGNRGGGSGGGGFFFGGANGGSQSRTGTTSNSRTGTGNGSGGGSTLLVEALIKLLQSKIQGG